MGGVSTFCPNPWSVLDTLPDGSLGPCCFFETKSRFKLEKNQGLSDYLRSDILKSVKYSMLNNQKHSACKYCYKREGYGDFSPRISNYSKAGEASIRESPDREFFSGIHLRLSNVCNLSCRSCGVFCSSAWNADYLKLFPGRDPLILNLFNENESFQDDVFQLIESSINYLYISGGEPMLDTRFEKVLKAFVLNKNKKKLLRVQTNLSADRYFRKGIDFLFSKIENIELMVSIDGVADCAEFLRNGLKWDQFNQNLINIRDNYKDVKLVFTPTVSIYNVYHILDVIDYLVINKFLPISRLELNLVNKPSVLNPQLLDDKIKAKISLRYKKYLTKINNPLLKEQIEIFLFEILAFLSKDSEVNKFDFLLYTKKLDRIRGQDSFSLFPFFTKL